MLHFKVIVFFVVAIPFFASSQELKEERTQILNSIITSRNYNNDNNLYLCDSMYSTFAIHVGNMSDLYIELQNYIDSASLDSLNKVCKKVAQQLVWEKDINISRLKVVSEEEGSKIISYSSTSVVQVRHKRWCKKITRKKVIKEADFSNVLIKTSPPLFFNNYCIVTVSTTRGGGTNGDICILLFIKKNNVWETELVMQCKIS